MIPAMLILPAAVPSGFFGTLINPSSIMVMIGGVAVSGAVGLCLALIHERRTTGHEAVRSRTTMLVADGAVGA